MEISRAINIAAGCVTVSYLEMNEKRDVIDSLRKLEKKKTTDAELTVHDIECKIQERMEFLEKSGKNERLTELRLLMDWLLCGEEY